jgi:hypothetical protein
MYTLGLNQLAQSSNSNASLYASPAFSVGSLSGSAAYCCGLFQLLTISSAFAVTFFGATLVLCLVHLNLLTTHPNENRGNFTRTKALGNPLTQCFCALK